MVLETAVIVLLVGSGVQLLLQAFAIFRNSSCRREVNVEPDGATHKVTTLETRSNEAE